jgi:RNA-directed DNA polymerase
VVEVDSSMSEKPEHQRPRRLADWINPTGARKAHSLIDKVYKRKNLEMAWEKVKANKGAGGMTARVSRRLAHSCKSGW